MNKTEILKFLDAQNIIILCTLDTDGAPESRALINIRNSKIAPHLTEFFRSDNRILMITNTSSAKIRQIRENADASLYMFNDKFSGLLLKGKIHEILDAKTRDALWDDSWKMYYPDGKDGGDFSVLELVPETFKSYANFSVTKGKIE
jgi:general stress protein 26